MVDERGLLMRLELYLKRAFVFAVLAEHHPAGGGLFRHLLHHAQAPPGCLQLQNKGAAGHWFELDWHCGWIALDCVGLRWIALDCVGVMPGGNSIFFLIATFSNAKDEHEQQNYLKQDR